MSLSSQPQHQPCGQKHIQKKLAQVNHVIARDTGTCVLQTTLGHNETMSLLSCPWQTFQAYDIGHLLWAKYSLYGKSLDVNP